MTDLSIKISIRQIYPIDLFLKYEGLELILRHGQAFEEKQHYPYKNTFNFNLSKVRKDFKIEVKLLYGVVTVASGELKISVLQILERREVGEQLVVLDFNQNSKRKIFGLIPYSSIRFATSYCFIYPDTPFGNQNIYKSNSLRNIVNLANIKVNKKIVLPEWHSRNKRTGGAYISNNMGSTTKTNTKTTSKYNNNNFKKIKMYFNKTIISSWSPKKVTKKQSYNNINTDLIIKENKRKIKDLHNKIAKVMLPNEKFEKKNPIKICKMVAEIRAKSQKKKVNKLNETQKSIFSEQQSMDMNDFFDYNNLNDKFFSMLNFNQQIQDSLIPIYDMDINNKTTLNKEEIKEIIQVFFNIQNIYSENYLNLFNKNKLFKKKYSDIIYRLDLIDDILKEYKLIQNNLSYKNDSKALTELRDQNLESIEKSLLRELRLIKYFRLQYDYEEHKNNEKKLLKDIIMKITQSDKFTKLSEDKRKNIIEYHKNFGDPNIISEL